MGDDKEKKYDSEFGDDRKDFKEGGKHVFQVQ
jgi:hypothetical protein